MKQKKGVTLIALVITIIVLLILAGVSISLVVGDSGVFSEADQATSQTDLSANREALERALVGKQGEFTTQWDGDNTETYYDWLKDQILGIKEDGTVNDSEDPKIDKTGKKDVLVEDGYVITLSVKNNSTPTNVGDPDNRGIIGTIQKAQKGSTTVALDGATKYVFELGNKNDDFLGIDIYAADLKDDFFDTGKAGGKVTNSTASKDYSNTVSGVEELDEEVINWPTTP